MNATRIPGYTRGTPDVARSPLTMDELNLLKETVLFSADDERYLKMAGETLADQIEDVLDVWYGFVASHPHLVHSFSGTDGNPHGDYLAAVRPRFGQWIRDTCSAQYDQDWLDYQQEIALRHTPAGKNRTDQVASAADHVALRYLIAFIVPITATMRPFLEKKGAAADDVDNMHQAWFKSVVLQVSLWSEPYTRPGMY